METIVCKCKNDMPKGFHYVCEVSYKQATRQMRANTHKHRNKRGRRRGWKNQNFLGA